MHRALDESGRGRVDAIPRHWNRGIRRSPARSTRPRRRTQAFLLRRRRHSPGPSHAPDRALRGPDPSYADPMSILDEAVARARELTIQAIDRQAIDRQALEQDIAKALTD